ncbi:hypothetical protein C8R45DRAFT_1217398 [Mycena sanguinolenta]|nr:hypothetical protein C8R45DRAFT_1217398 [Mycena sanguinolenta]
MFDINADASVAPPLACFLHSPPTRLELATFLQIAWATASHLDCSITVFAVNVDETVLHPTAHPRRRDGVAQGNVEQSFIWTGANLAMPDWEVWHSYPLTEAQRNDLAQRITIIHTTLFTVPAAFVHVRIANYAATEHYIAGKKRRHSKPGLEAAWTASVGDLATQDGAHAHLAAASYARTVTAAYEQGFMAPEAGHDVEWMRENLLKFQALADDGNGFFQDMISELRRREDFKFVFENRSA